MSKGWIAIHRQIQDHWIWQDPEKLRAWLDLIMMANHEGQDIFLREGVVHVERGQLVTSIGKLADRWKWSKDRVRRFLTLLSATNMILRVSDTRKTTLTLINYGFYQDMPTSDKYTNKTPNKTSDKTSGKTRTTINNNVEQFNNIESLSPTLDGSAPAPEESESILTDEEWEKLPDV